MRKTIFLMFQYGWILKLGLITTATVFSTKNGVKNVGDFLSNDGYWLSKNMC